MSAAAQPIPLEMDQATWWKRPEAAARNAGIPYVVQTVNDGISATQFRILGALREGGQRQQDNAWICEPGGYSAIARAAKCCRKTVYNAVRDLKRKGIIVEYSIVMRGKKREKTIWLIRSFRAILDAWRDDAALFHTALKRVVVRGRRARLMTIEDARDWQIDPIRAPRRGSGRALTEAALARHAAKRAPAPEALPSDDDIAAVYSKLQWAQARPNLKDAIDVIRAARREAERLAAGELPAAVIAQLVEAIARDYKPSRENAERFPTPRPAWFLQKIAGYTGQWAQRHRPPDPNARTG